MKPIFSRGPSLQIRLILAVLVALGIIIADSRLGTFNDQNPHPSGFLL